MITQPEKYLPPGEISLGLLSRYGFERSPSFIRAIRTESLKRGEKLFVMGDARVSEVFIWISNNPQFRAQPVALRKKAA